MAGTLYIISAPSGTGKSSLIQALLKKNKLYDINIRLSVSHTTRAPRAGEVHGKDYFFINNNEFKTMIYKDAFIEHAEINGNWYGTSNKTIKHVLTTDIDVFLDINWQGAQQIRKKIKHTSSIFILPPSRNELNRRLRNRGKDSEDIIAKRMANAIAEISHYYEYDYIIINDNFDIALNDLKTIIKAQHLRVNNQIHKNKDLITKLLEY